jgi:hypothetical protein
MARDWRSVCVAAGLLGACVSDGLRHAPPDAGTASFARVEVRLALPRGGEPGVESRAAFVRFAGVDAEAALTLAGAGGGELDLAPGRCARVSSDARLDGALSATAPDATVWTLDAGDLAVQAAGRLDRLTAGHAPELLPFVTGPVYAAQGGAAPEWGTGEVRVTGFGGDGVAPFDASGAIPPLPRVLEVNGVPVGDAPATIEPGTHLLVRWAGAGAAAAGDEVSVVLEWGVDGEEIRCRPGDGSAVVVPRALLATLDTGAPVTLAVERTRRGGFTAGGVDVGELWVSARDVVELRWREPDAVR